MKMVEKKGRIITIEGSDGSGKATQAKLLVERAMKAGYKVETMSFPQYDKPTGKRVKDYLDGKFGDIKSVDVRFVIRLYADDRLEAKPQIMKWLDGNENIIFDRWIESNMGHQAAKVSASSRGPIVDWIRDLESRQNGLPESDMVVYLDLPVEWTQEAMRKEEEMTGEKKGKDLHERDVNYLLKTQETYKWLARTSQNWRIIDCLKDSESGKIRKTIQEINDEIWKIVEPALVR